MASSPVDAMVSQRTLEPSGSHHRQSLVLEDPKLASLVHSANSTSPSPSPPPSSEPVNRRLSLRAKGKQREIPSPSPQAHSIGNGKAMDVTQMETTKPPPVPVAVTKPTTSTSSTKAEPRATRSSTFLAEARERRDRKLGLGSAALMQALGMGKGESLGMGGTDSDLEDEDEENARNAGASTVGMLPTTTFCLTTSETTIDLASSEGANSVAGPSTLDNDGLTEGEKKQMLIETPDYRILSETDALGRLRFKSEDIDPTDSSIYQRLHRFPEVLEKRSKRRERERLVHERFQLSQKIEKLRSALATGQLFSGGGSSTGEGGGKGKGTTKTREEADRFKRQLLTEAEETLKRYDALLEPRAPPAQSTTASTVGAASTAGGTPAGGPEPALARSRLGGGASNQSRTPSEREVSPKITANGSKLKEKFKSVASRALSASAGLGSTSGKAKAQGSRVKAKTPENPTPEPKTISLTVTYRDPNTGRFSSIPSRTSSGGNRRKRESVGSESRESRPTKRARSEKEDEEHVKEEEYHDEMREYEIDGPEDDDGDRGRRYISTSVPKIVTSFFVSEEDKALHDTSTWHRDLPSATPNEPGSKPAQSPSHGRTPSHSPSRPSRPSATPTRQPGIPYAFGERIPSLSTQHREFELHDFNTYTWSLTSSEGQGFEEEEIEGVVTLRGLMRLKELEWERVEEEKRKSMKQNMGLAGLRGTSTSAITTKTRRSTRSSGAGVEAQLQAQTQTEVEMQAEGSGTALAS